VSREHLKKIDPELEERYGKSCLATMRCPVCDSEFIDLDKVSPGGETHVGESNRRMSR
jgi:hypothetical protein